MADDVKYNSTPSLDEIVFENRNKEYGAYDLRNRYPKILTRAFLLGTFIFILVALMPFIVMKIQQMNATEKTEVDANLVEILDDTIIEEIVEEEPEPPKVEEEPPPEIEIIQNVVPEPKKAPKVETPPPPIQQQLETNTGLINQEGVKTPDFVPPPKLPSTGTKAATVDVKPQVDVNKIYPDVEQLAEFPGGINAFRTKVSNSFDGSVMDGDEGNVKSEITFVVERDGSITDVRATGDYKYFNEEAIRTVKSIKNKWTPAKINGQNVRYRYRLPLVMAF